MRRGDGDHLCTGWCQDNIGGGPCSWYCNSAEKCLGANARGTGWYVTCFSFSSDDDKELTVW
jgi:hypothetical protein